MKKIDGLNIVIPNSVYDPAEDSFLLAENTDIKLNEKVLEIGSGSGYVSIYLAKKNPSAEFFSIDLNYIASKTTLINSINNSVKLNITTGDLFDSLIEKPFFDVILFNAPYLPVINNNKESIAWAGGHDGLEIIERYIKQLRFFLKKTGRSYLVVSNKTNIKKLFKLIKQNQLSYELIDEIKEGHEKIKLYRINNENRKC